MIGRPLPRFYLAVATAFALLVATLMGVRLKEAWDQAGRGMGAYGEDTANGLEVTRVVPDGPADVAGIEVDDILIRVNGRDVFDRDDYIALALEFERGETISVVVRRAGSERSLEAVPGVPVDWREHWSHALVAAVCLALGVLTLVQRADDLRARLVAAFSFLLAVELALPTSMGSPTRIGVLGMSLFLLVTGLQMAVELHLAALTPNRPRWLSRHRWVVPIFYAVGLGGGLLAWATFHLERGLGASPLPWNHEQSQIFLDDVLLPIWALGVVVLLALPALRHEEARGRHQAGLVLLGVLPWALYILWSAGAPHFGWPVPIWLQEQAFPFLVLGFPVAVFVAIYRYHLFDLELVVRRGFVYGALTAALVALFYGTVAGLGSLYAKMTDAEAGERASVWVVGLAMLVVGLAFDSVRRGIQRTLDRFFFPERQALRRHLVDLASELPARGGTVSAMGKHLVERLAEIFTVGSTDLLLADPRGGLLFSVASSQGERDRSSLSFLVPPDDPGLVRLRQAGRPLPASQVLRDGTLLAHRLVAMEAQLVVPLLREEQLVGVLALGRRSGNRRFGREEEDLLSLLGHHVAVVFENIRLFESATYEGLTGLLRREAILELLDREIERARRYGRPLVVGMADLDFFKAVNDTWGHLAGDAVLKRVAEELAAGLRKTDSVGRYGGEEFLLVLPETELEGGRAVAEKLRRRVENLSLEMGDGARVDPRISLGLADLASVEGPCTRRGLIDAADRALYRAKQRGRNRVELAETTSEGAAGGAPG